MKHSVLPKSIFWLGLAVLAAAYVSIRHDTKVSGLAQTYIATAAWIGFWGAISWLAARAKERNGASPNAVLLLYRRATILNLVAWDFVIVGEYNLWAYNYTRSNITFMINVIAIMGWLFISDRLVALTDDPDQNSGAKPIRLFGTHRPRRAFFWGLVVLPFCGIVLFGITLFMQAKVRHPDFQTPQIFLLFMVIVSAGVTILAYQRYRRDPFSKQQAMIISIATPIIVGIEGAYTLLNKASLYLYVASSIIISCLALSTQLLFRATYENNK